MASDRISSLPDSVLCHILSFLPTRTSVTTSILSRRWRHLWKYLQCFTFSVQSFTNGGKLTGLAERKAHRRFVAFVNAVLVQRRARDIRKFSLDYDIHHAVDAAATTWVYAALGPHLEELQLKLWREFVLPPSVFTCTALVNLVWRSSILVEPTQASKVSLPSLKTLTVELNHYSLDNIDKVLSGCPVLETLNLRVRSTLGPREGSTPSMKRLNVPSLKSLKFDDGCDGLVVEFEIDTPSLEYLSIDIANLDNKISFCNLPKVVKAHLNCCTEYKKVGYVPKLLKSLCRTKSLVMQRLTVECLLHAPELDYLPEFTDLVNLELHLSRHLSRFDASFLVNMLQRCNMLRVLTIYRKSPVYGAMDAPPSWTRPTNAPSCLVSQLSVVNFSLYDGSKDSQEFIAYILQNGLVLTAVTLEFDHRANLEKNQKNQSIREELSLIPRISKTCQLIFK